MTKQIRIEEELLNSFAIIYPNQDEKKAINNALELFIELKNHAAYSFRGVFTAQELRGIISSLNGTMFEPKFAIIKDAFIAHLEDSERFESISSNFSFSFSQLLEKVKSLNQFQLCFLQEDISNFWQHQASKEGSLDSFIKKYM